MKRNSILLLLCAVLLHWHSAFEFGAFADFDDWKTFKEILVELEHKVVDEQNSAIKPSLLQTMREELQFLMSMVNKNKLPVQLDESSDKYLELYRLVSGAISYCIELLKGTDHFGREANEEYLNGLKIRIRSIVLSLRREFGTFLLQFELNFIEKESWPKVRLTMLNERLDEISTLVRHDKTYCAVAYFEGEKEKLVKLLRQNSSNTLDEKEIEQAIKKMVVEIKLNIFMQELDAKIAAFDNPCIYGRGFILFFEELQSQLSQIEIGRKTFDELQKTVLDKTNPLKQKILKQLDDLFSGFKSEIETLITKISGFESKIKTSELKQKLQKNKYNEISAKIRELKSEIKTLVQKLKEPFGKLLMNMQIIGLPQYNVFVIVMEMECACNAMNSNPDWNKKVFEDGIKKIQERIDIEKKKINASYEFKASNFVQAPIMGTTFGFLRPGLDELQQKLDELEKKSVQLEHKDHIEVDRLAN